MGTALRVKDLCKTYIVNKRQNNVLKNISFEIEDGEMVAVMGPSGSGKSTLLYSVSGMDRPTAGKVEVGVKEYALLLYLMENKGKVLTKEKLFNTVWGYGSDSEIQTLTVHIKWLREKLEKDSKKPEHILTVWGVGYRFE